MRKLLFNLLVLFLAGNLTLTLAQSGRVRPRNDGKRATAETPPATSAANTNTTTEKPNAIPQGTVIELRLDQSLSSKTNNKGDAFTATVSEPVFINNSLMLGAGITVKCHIINVQPAARKGRNGSITFGFDELILDNGDTLKLQATLISVADRRDDVVDESGEGKVKDTSKGKNVPLTVGTSTGVGATIGAVSGAGVGVGAGVGAGIGLGSVLLSKGRDVELLAGLRMQIKLDSDLRINSEAAPTEK
ncbi:MAG: hypothetical protein AB1489_26990 [Acidobacteriota bacterium]